MWGDGGLADRKELDSQYHFSCQFTADLIAMNAADFIITSTYQEVRASCPQSKSKLVGIMLCRLFFCLFLVPPPFLRESSQCKEGALVDGCLCCGKRRASTADLEGML